MISREPVLSVMLLSEDGSKHSLDVLRALAREIFLLIVPETQTQKIAWSPVDSAEAREAMCANGWLSPKSQMHRQTVALRRAIATQIARANGFVLFHYDGDCKWSERPTDKDRRFEDVIVERVRLLLAEALHCDPKASEIENRLSRLKRIVPYYSIESWLFQNVREAVALCRIHHGGQHEGWLADLAVNRSILDELDKPKEQCCLHSNYNLDLAAHGFPAREVFAANGSFAGSVVELRSCSFLVDALRSIWE